MRKLTIILLATLGIFLWFGPLLTGLVFKKHYTPIISEYFSHQAKIKILKYQRNWFSSQATLQISFDPTQTLHVFNSLGLNFKSERPLQIILEQTIQHGPVVFDFKNHFQPHFVYAVIKNKILIPPELKLILESYGISIANYIYTDDKITYSGKYKKNVVLLLPALRWRENGEGGILLEHLKLKTHYKADRATLSEKFLLDKIHFFDSRLGPLVLKMTAKNFNSEAVKDIVSAYREISKRGELYQNELRQRILTKLPTLIKPGTEFRIEELQLETPDGHLSLNASLHWAEKNLQAIDLLDILNEANLAAQIKISKKLADKILRFLSQTPYFYDVPPQMIKEISAMQEDATIAMQQNAFFLVYLVELQALKDEDGMEFMNFMKNNEIGEDYLNKIKTLFLTRTITRDAAYALLWQYSVIKNQINAMEQRALGFQESIYRQLRQQVDEWIKNGFVTQNKEEYFLSLTRENRIFKLNGKTVNLVQFKRK